MRIINLPTDWSKKYLAVGYAMTQEELDIALQAILALAKNDDNHFAILTVSNPDATIEFTELTVTGKPTERNVYEQLRREVFKDG